MLSLFGKCKSTAPMKGYKVTNKDRDKKYGIAANSLGMLKAKSSAKFNISNPMLYLAKDGTEVQDEDYFATLEPQTVFIIAAQGDRIKNDFELIYEGVRNKTEIIQSGSAIRKFLEDNKDIFSKYIKEYKSNKENCNLSSLKKDHEEWFKGQPENLQTKEQVMAKRSQDRIRGYFYKVKDDIMKSDLYISNKKAREILNTVLDIFKILLTAVEYFSSYFDRHCNNKHKSLVLNKNKDDDDIDGETPRKKLKEQVKRIFKDENDLSNELCVSLCTIDGDFLCHGIWNETNCTYEDHTINPYASRENAILFQIWNLDHKIEMSRSIIPSLLNNVKQIIDGNIFCDTHNQKCITISILTYFFEIFTMKNLKFVHIVCHDKGAHQIKSNGSMICEKCDEFLFIKKILNASRGV